MKQNTFSRDEVERKALEMGISLHRGTTGEPGRELVYQGL
jgi:hypothetical protein